MHYIARMLTLEQFSFSHQLCKVSSSTQSANRLMVLKCCYLGFNFIFRNRKITKYRIAWVRRMYDDWQHTVCQQKHLCWEGCVLYSHHDTEPSFSSIEVIFYINHNTQLYPNLSLYRTYKHRNVCFLVRVRISFSACLSIRPFSIKEQFQLSPLIIQYHAMKIDLNLTM